MTWNGIERREENRRFGSGRRATDVRPEQVEQQVPASKFIRAFGKHFDEVGEAPIAITAHGRAKAVLISARMARRLGLLAKADQAAQADADG